VYALLAERAEVMDRHMWAVALGTEKPSEVFEDLSERARLDSWLDAPIVTRTDAAAEKALIRYLQGA
jgi:hypothetical protein